MRKTTAILSIMGAMLFYASVAMSLDLGRSLRRAAGQVIDNAIQGNSSPSPQYYTPTPQPQPEYVVTGSESTSGSTTDYQKWLEGGTDSSTESTTNQSQERNMDTPSSNNDDDNPFADIIAANTKDDSRSGGASKEGDTIEVISTGIGQDSDRALRNALRAAIEQAVGTMVDSETLAQNDEVINDQILSYSAGFVESHKVISEPRTRDGLVIIKIQAQVKRTQLTEKLQAANIHIKEVDGESLFGEVITRLDQKQSAKDMLVKALTGFPENYLYATMEGKPGYNEVSNTLNITVKLSLNKDGYGDFSRNLSNLFKQIATENKTVDLPLAPFDNSLRIPLHLIFGNNRIGVIPICIQANEMRTNSNWNVFTVSQDLFNSIEINKPSLAVEIVDENNNTIISKTVETYVPYIYEFDYGMSGGKRNSRIVFLPFLSSGKIIRGPIDSIAPGRDYVLLNISFEVSANEIKKMRNIICTIKKGN